MTLKSTPDKGSRELMMDHQTNYSDLELQELREKYIPAAVFQLTKIAIKRAKGAKVWDQDGKEYLDFVGGIGCVNAGHSPDPVVDAIKTQSDQYLHPSINVMNYQPYVELAQKICDLTPGSYEKMAVFLNSGAEAVENAVKIARYYTKRNAVIAFDAGYHGRTLLTMSLTSKINPYKKGYGPFAPEIYHIPHPALVKVNSVEDYWKKIFSTTVTAHEVAAIIFEPVLGEGGFIPMPKDFVQHLRTVCDKEGIMMISDEIQTGFCRTGKLFAMEHFGVSPDLMTIGKSIASGMPLTAVVGKKEILASSHVGGLGGTFCGNPLSCAAALATLKIYEKENLAQRSMEIGNQIVTFFSNLKKQYQCIGHIHGLGAMVGIDFVDTDGKPDSNLLRAIMGKALEEGVILMSSGLDGNILRILVPLVISDDELQQAFSALERAFQKHFS